MNFPALDNDIPLFDRLTERLQSERTIYLLLAKYLNFQYRPGDHLEVIISTLSHI